MKNFPQGGTPFDNASEIGHIGWQARMSSLFLTLFNQFTRPVFRPSNPTSINSKFLSTSVINLNKIALLIALLYTSSPIAFGGRHEKNQNVGKTDTLLSAAKNCDIKEMQRHLKNGCDVNQKMGDEKRTALQAVASSGSDDALKAAKFLLLKGADINGKDNTGKTPIFFAENKKMMQLIIEKGARIDEEDNNGVTALMYSAGYNDTKKLKFLISNKANVNHVTKIGFSALHLAIQHKKLESVKILLLNGADPSAILSCGDGPKDCLELAKETGSSEILLEVKNALDATKNKR